MYLCSTGKFLGSAKRKDREMKITPVVCTNCGASFKVKSLVPPKSVACPKCSKVVVLSVSIQSSQTVGTDHTPPMPTKNLSISQAKGTANTGTHDKNMEPPGISVVVGIISAAILWQVIGGFWGFLIGYVVGHILGNIIATNITAGDANAPVQASSFTSNPEQTAERGTTDQTNSARKFDVNPDLVALSQVRIRLRPLIVKRKRILIAATCIAALIGGGVTFLIFSQAAFFATLVGAGVGQLIGRILLLTLKDQTQLSKTLREHELRYEKATQTAEHLLG